MLVGAAGIANARLNQVREFLDHPVLEARERWQTVSVPGGKMTALRRPVDHAGVDPVMGPVPALGEHTGLILRELGRRSRAVV